MSDVTVVLGEPNMTGGEIVGSGLKAQGSGQIFENLVEGLA
jgi:hypothetical protein